MYIAPGHGQTDKLRVKYVSLTVLLSQYSTLLQVSPPLNDFVTAFPI